MAVKLANVFETIMYEYAKLIADRAVEDRESLAPAERESKEYWSFVWHTFRKLSTGRITISAILRENKLLVEAGNRCAYCGAFDALQWEHIIPASRNGPSTIDNMVLSCPKCNREKAARNPIEWYDARGLHRKHIPRLVMGKLLKVVLEEHRSRGTDSANEYPRGAGLHLHNVCLVFDHALPEAQASSAT
ncbi:MAG: HNH endonuclease [Burkholderiales bacterium]|nr:HNH endonuclease [Burkholderiales bacterium]